MATSSKYLRQQFSDCIPRLLLAPSFNNILAHPLRAGGCHRGVSRAFSGSKCAFLTSVWQVRGPEGVRACSSRLRCIVSRPCRPACEGEQVEPDRMEPANSREERGRAGVFFYASPFPAKNSYLTQKTTRLLSPAAGRPHVRLLRWFLFFLFPTTPVFCPSPPTDSLRRFSVIPPRTPTTLKILHPSSS
jgi:hypothetical protein